MNIAKFFHQKTKTKYEPEKDGQTDPRPFLLGPRVWPKEWTIIYFKEYPRMPKILLPKPVKLDFSLGEAVTKRRSERGFNNEPVELKNLSQLLFYSAGIIEKREDNWNKTRRAYASAGARYPLEIYLFVLRGNEEIKEGIYHYNVKEHLLEKLIETNLRKKIYSEIIWQEMVLKAPVLLIISAIFERNMMKYKERGYRYILLEAGHLGQNIYLVSTALGLKCCAIGGFDEDKFHQLLDIDGEEEGVLYVFALGY